MALLKWTLALLLILPAIGAPRVGPPPAAPERPEAKGGSRARMRRES
jgi:hypothetical protein